VTEKGRIAPFLRGSAQGAVTQDDDVQMAAMRLLQIMQCSILHALP
jgi:hypothetical protein